jgi:hypothetical protein
MEIINFKDVAILDLFIKLQVVLSWHVVALVPVGLPATADRKTCSVVQSNLTFFLVSECIGRRNVTNIVMKVHALNVRRILSHYGFEAVLTFS